MFSPENPATPVGPESASRSTVRRFARRLGVVLVLVLLLSAVGYAAEAAWLDRFRANSPGSPAAVTRDLQETATAPAPAVAPRRTPRPPRTPRLPRPLRPSAAVALPALETRPALLAPGDTGPEVRELQARLRQIYWFNTDVTGDYAAVTVEAVRGFQAKREIPVTGEVDQVTMNRLLDMTTPPTQAALENRIGYNEPGALDPRCRTGRVLCIDKTSRTLRWVVGGEVASTVDVRFGASTTPTREGVFSVYRKSRDHVSTLYDSAMPFAMFFDGGQAVHYSSDFAATGYNGASHGCVNVRDYDAIAALYDLVAVGDRVVIYNS